MLGWSGTPSSTGTWCRQSGPWCGPCRPAVRLGKPPQPRAKQQPNHPTSSRLTIEHEQRHANHGRAAQRHRPVAGPVRSPF
ncbi:MAG: hypothetical protein DCF26_01340 [Burkholderiales bacterium]|nr:MAG: hypothetical protein DCF26_01340 [Burkholderiales bacterium]